MTPNQEDVAKRAEAQQYVEDLELMFITPGWSKLIDTFRGFDDAITSTALQLSTVEDFWVAKGRHDAFLQLLGFQDFLEGFKEDIDKEAANGP